MKPTASPISSVNPAQAATLYKAAASQEIFTGDENLVLDQADWVEIVNLGPFNDCLGRERWFAVFSRRVMVLAPDGFVCETNGMMWGEEIMAYDCDADGVVSDWTMRLEFRAHSYDAAVRKLRFAWQNCLTSYVPAPTSD